MTEFRLPFVPEGTQREQLEAIKGFLYQTVEQLNAAMGALERKQQTIPTVQRAAAAAGQAESAPEKTFQQVKALIIKSADIVNAYYEEISKRLEGLYVARSDFGSYQEKTSQELTANSRDITLLFQNLQTVSGTVEGLSDAALQTSAYLRSGLLYYTQGGSPVYGLEIGQTNTVDGEEVFNKFARFSADKLSFYDNNDTEVAYISDYKMHITNAEVTGSLTLGHFLLDTSNGLAIKWAGR